MSVLWYLPLHTEFEHKCFDVVRKAITVELCVQEVKRIEDLGRDFTVQIFERTFLFILLTVRIMGN